MSMNMVYTEFAKDLEKYLQNKLVDIPPHLAEEIGVHIANKTMILVSDMMREYDRELKCQMRKNALRRHKTTSSMEEEKCL